MWPSRSRDTASTNPLRRARLVEIRLVFPQPRLLVEQQIAESGEIQHLQRRLPLAQLPRELMAEHPRHPLIGEQQIERPEPRGDLGGLVAARCDGDFVAGIAAAPSRPAGESPRCRRRRGRGGGGVSSRAAPPSSHAALDRLKQSPRRARLAQHRGAPASTPSQPQMRIVGAGQHDHGNRSPSPDRSSGARRPRRRPCPACARRGRWRRDVEDDRVAMRSLATMASAPRLAVTISKSGASATSYMSRCWTLSSTSRTSRRFRSRRETFGTGRVVS